MTFKRSAHGGINGSHPNPKRDEILALLRAGMGPTAVARELGVTKNVVVGYSKRNDLSGLTGPAPSTVYDRMLNLHAKLDAVLAATVGVGRVPNEPRH